MGAFAAGVGGRKLGEKEAGILTSSCLIISLSWSALVLYEIILSFSMTHIKLNQLLSRENIKLYSTENEEKSSVAERFNRTIKQKMWKMFSANNNTIYVDKIGELLKNYNSSFHRSVQMSPVAASDIKNTHQVFANLYSDEIYKQVKKPKFRIGDRVRISKYKRKLFDKGFTPNWAEEIFVINQILHAKPVTYRVVDLQGSRDGKLL